jgi:hypothetical protein
LIELQHITDNLFEIGLEERVVCNYKIRIYDLERCVCDAIRRRLLNVAKSESIFYQTILTRYFQERLLYRMSQTSYKSNFYLKGGALIYAFEHFANLQDVSSIPNERFVGRIEYALN